MKVTISFLLCVCLLFVGVFGQSGWTRPDPSETFQSNVTFHERNGTHETRGYGVHATDRLKQLNFQRSHFESRSELELYRLQRYSDKVEYDIDSEEDGGRCQKRVLDTNMTDHWAWVKLSNHSHNYTEGGAIIDVWSFETGFARVELAVNRTHPNVPIWERRTSQTREYTVYFETWSTQPNGNYFQIPRECGGSVMSPRAMKIGFHNVSTSCRARADMISVAKAWVAAKVPYNQGAHHDGYREDCSGYVSACWASAKPGAVTSTFHTISHPITKSELADGDCLLYAAEHVVLFGGWTDSAKTHYHAYEETRPGEGTVGPRTTPYPYWYSTADFKPYRANTVC